MNEILNNVSVKRVQKALNTFDGKLKILTLNQVAKTAEDASKALNCNIGAIVKSLLFKAEDKFILCLIPGDKKCSLKKLKKAINKKDVSMANAEQVKKQTGFSIGGVSPVGHINKIEIFIDLNFGRFTKVYAAAGHPNSIFGIEITELYSITGGKGIDISE